MKAGRRPYKIVDGLYLRCFVRLPEAGEKEKLLVHFQDDKNQEQVLADAFWGLLNSKEFIINH